MDYNKYTSLILLDYVIWLFTGATAAISVIAALHGIDSQASVDWARGQIDYMLGNNPLGISYQIKEAALGWSPRKPHHRGALVVCIFALYSVIRLYLPLSDVLFSLDYKERQFYVSFKARYRVAFNYYTRTFNY